ncbi:MAG: transglycosylase SLT domain-containing protein [Anaerolineaceae bacterium]
MAVCSKPSSRRMLVLALGALLVCGACGGSSSKPTVAFLAPEPTPVPPTAVPTPYNTPVVAVPNVAEALASAREVLREGRFDTAAAMYGALAAVTSNGSIRAQALVGSSIARYSDGDREGALVAVSEAARVAPGGSPESVSAGYLLGVRLNEAERFEDAAAALASVMSRSGALAPYIAGEYARALASSGRPLEAAAAWDALLVQGDLPVSLRASVLRERVAAARAAGDDAALVRWLDGLIGFSGDAPALLERAQKARASGEPELSAQLLTRLVATQPDSRLAVQAVVLLHEAGVTVDAGQEGLIYYRRGAYPEARRVLLAGIAEPGISSATLAFRLYYLAAAYEDAGLPDKAIVYYDQAAKAGGSDVYTHRARYWAARVTERSGDKVGAGARYRALVSEGPAGEFTAEASFRAGYTLFSAGDAAGAVSAWDAVGGGGGARVAFWKGRALATLGRVMESGVEYQRAVKLGPLDFYGSEAARELKQAPAIDTSYRPRNLGAKTDWSVIAAWLGQRVPGSFPGTVPTAAAELAWVGLREQAAGVLNDAAVGAGAWRLLELAREAQGAGVMDVAAQLAVRVRIAAGAESADVPRDLLRVSYPVDYVTQLDTEAKANNLDPLFFAALVRQESFWDPAAGSGAGALGLTQVIPETGNGIARALEVREFVPQDLFRPAVSLRFGAYYLAGQVRRFGQPWAALSAYNAGPGNAARWVEATGRGGAADFVEEVDFEETSHYVLVVLEHYAHYLRAYGD